MKTLPWALAWALALVPVPAALADRAARDEPATFQAFLGVLELDDQSGEWDEISDADVDVDFTTLPGGGLEAEYVFYEGWVHVGLNPGGSLAFKSDNTSFSGAFSGDSGSELRVELDNSLFLFELHLGAYVRGRLHERVTTYAAAGPMILYGYHDVEDESVEPETDLDLSASDASDINIGYYARAGIDFEYRDNQHFGLGVRYLSAELDFDDTVGQLDIEGPQWVLTYTRRY